MVYSMRATRPSSDVPWYAEARRRFLASRDYHARRRARKQQERAEEIEREARRQRERAEELEREQQRKLQLQQELEEMDERGARHMLGRFVFSFEIERDRPLISSRGSSEVVHCPASRAHTPEPHFGQGRDRRSDAPGPESRRLAGPQGRQQGPAGGNNTRHLDDSMRAWINYVRSCRPANWRNSLIRY